MKLNPKVIILFYGLSFVMLFSCGTSEEFQNSATADYSREKLQKFSKYMIQGKQLYTTHCSNCHQEDGTGLGSLYPPVAQSDYMEKNFTKTPCIIKYGMKKEIEVNGKIYKQAMPALKKLNALEIAEITTYLYNSWGAEKGLISIKEINKYLDACKQE